MGDIKSREYLQTYEMDNAPVHALSMFLSVDKGEFVATIEHLGLVSLPCCTF